jgi:hypothetical protein
MNKLFRINKLAATALIIATLFGCNNQSSNATDSGGNTTPSTESEPPSQQQTEMLDKVVEQQEEQPEQKEDVDKDPLPAEYVKQAYTAPAELKYYNKSDEYLFQKFYPIGWSKNGLFAYVIEPADEAAGQYFFKLVIKNMISDKEVYVWEPDDELENGSVKQMWKDYNMTFAEKLNEYKIIPQKDIKLLGTEFTTDNGKYKVTIENKMETDPDYGFEVVKTTNIHIKSQELGSKQIYSYTEKDFNPCLGRIVQGVIKSPYENRVAVFVREELRGYEGPPNVIQQFLVGADLERSFKK